MPATVLTAPELMAPAGDWDCAKAAVANGADAVYFGLQGGLNARARAVNFTPAELPELMAFLRVRGVKGYLTLNTLVFGDELEEAERVVRLAVAAGVDAVLVQDLGLLRLIGRLCPELPLHASTQMTLSSAECIDEAAVAGRAAGGAAAGTLHRPDRRHPPPNRASNWRPSSTAPCASATPANAWPAWPSAGGAATAASAPSPAGCPTR